uniref:7TM_GPCR_Srx domain-containing protein n=1 Tax=Caenorhabditis tropicalis TaxID=1561998 RepID=A0A1I7U984_9PELO
MLEDFGINVDEITYIIADFYPIDDNGQTSPSLATFVSGINFLFMTTVSLIVIFVFGFKCYFEMTRVAVPGRNYSITQKLLQTQLFRALVFQTLIPLTIMYLPLFVLFIFPMFNINVGFAHYVSISISLYPALDALPNLLLIRDYRDSLYNILRKPHEVTLNMEPYYIRRGSATVSSARKSTVNLN